MAEPKPDLWKTICSRLNLEGPNWGPQLASIMLVMSDHADRVTEHVQDDTTMVEDVENWLKYEAEQALKGAPRDTAKLIDNDSQ
jgi:hypothetical protein